MLPEQFFSKPVAELLNLLLLSFHFLLPIFALHLIVFILMAMMLQAIGSGSWPKPTFVQPMVVCIN